MKTQQAVWEPQFRKDGTPGPQWALITCPREVTEIGYGGARGGGKTDGAIGDGGARAIEYGRRFKGVFVRRVLKSLYDTIERAKEVYLPLGAEFSGGSPVKFTFPGGGEIIFTHLYDLKAATQFKGGNKTWFCFEELTEWPDDKPFLYVKGSLRSVWGIPVVIIATFNPGGVGHNWVRARYIDPAPNGYAEIIDPESDEKRVFIPAKLEDNPKLMENDPMYERRIMSIGNPELAKAWRWGIWDIAAGGFFEKVWDPRSHVLPMFKVPKTWRMMRSFDWGYSRPASLGFWGVSDGSQVPGLDIWFPRGSMVRVGELYTVRRENGIAAPNEGMQMTNDELGREIAKASKRVLRLHGHKAFKGCVADPSIFTQAGGKSLYQQLQAGSRRAGHALLFKEADNTRVAGWQNMVLMLEQGAKSRAEEPGMWVCENCTDFIRTVPTLPRDEDVPDEVNTEAEDHVADEARYASMTFKMKRVIKRARQGG